MRFQRADPENTGELVDVDGDVPAGTPIYVQSVASRFILEEDPFTGAVTLNWEMGTISVMRPHGSGAKLVPVPWKPPTPLSSLAGPEELDPTTNL